jgi:hypothetical protein
MPDTLSINQRQEMHSTSGISLLYKKYIKCLSRGPGLIPGTNRFSEEQWVWNGVQSASWAQLKSYLKEQVTAPV